MLPEVQDSVVEHSTAGTQKRVKFVSGSIQTRFKPAEIAEVMVANIGDLPAGQRRAPLVDRRDKDDFPRYAAKSPIARHIPSFSEHWFCHICKIYHGARFQKHTWPTSESHRSICYTESEGGGAACLHPGQVRAGCTDQIMKADPVRRIAFQRIFERPPSPDFASKELADMSRNKFHAEGLASLIGEPWKTQLKRDMQQWLALVQSNQIAAKHTAHCPAPFRMIPLPRRVGVLGAPSATLTVVPAYPTAVQVKGYYPFQNLSKFDGLTCLHESRGLNAIRDGFTPGRCHCLPPIAFGYCLSCRGLEPMDVADGDGIRPAIDTEYRAAIHPPIDPFRQFANSYNGQGAFCLRTPHPLLDDESLEYRDPDNPDSRGFCFLIRRCDRCAESLSNCECPPKYEVGCPYCGLPERRKKGVYRYCAASARTISAAPSVTVSEAIARTREEREGDAHVLVINGKILKGLFAGRYTYDTREIPLQSFWQEHRRVIQPSVPIGEIDDGHSAGGLPPNTAPFTRDNHPGLFQLIPYPLTHWMSRIVWDDQTHAVQTKQAKDIQAAIDAGFPVTKVPEARSKAHTFPYPFWVPGSGKIVPPQEHEDEAQQAADEEEIEEPVALTDELEPEATLEDEEAKRPAPAEEQNDPEWERKLRGMEDADDIPPLHFTEDQQKVAERLAGGSPLEEIAIELNVSLRKIVEIKRELRELARAKSLILRDAKKISSQRKK